MKVYHGGTDTIKLPLTHIGRDDLDFGKGFYVTDIRSQAEAWARRQANLREADAIVNVYELDLATAGEQFRYKRFEHYDKAWLDFIVGNRKGLKLWESFDLIEGGVADDRVVDTVESYMSGLLTPELALDRLMHHKTNNQFCITNQEVANTCLRFVESIILETK